MKRQSTPTGFASVKIPRQEFDEWGTPVGFATWSYAKRPEILGLCPTINGPQMKKELVEAWEAESPETRARAARHERMGAPREEFAAPLHAFHEAGYEEWKSLNAQHLMSRRPYALENREKNLRRYWQLQSLDVTAAYEHCENRIREERQKSNLILSNIVRTEDKQPTRGAFRTTTYHITGGCMSGDTIENPKTNISPIVNAGDETRAGTDFELLRYNLEKLRSAAGKLAVAETRKKDAYRDAAELFKVYAEASETTDAMMTEMETLITGVANLLSKAGEDNTKLERSALVRETEFEAQREALRRSELWLARKSSEAEYWKECFGAAGGNIEEVARKMAGDLGGAVEEAAIRENAPKNEVTGGEAKNGSDEKTE